jgi:N-acetylneuraminate synthase
MSDRAVRFVAEVSSNHHRDLDRCFTFIDTAARVGCYAVKFQLFRIDELFAPQLVAADPEIAARREWELPLEFVPELAKHCQEAGVEFSCTPFYLEAVEQLREHVAFYKIASYELIWDALLERCARTGIPVVLSTGMATLEEVQHAARVLRRAGCQDLTLLHCVSRYPTRIDECNLAALETLRSACGCAVGWSDHSVNPLVIQRAVQRWDASLIEFHFDLDGTGAEFSSGHCWLPEQIAPVIRDLRESLRADGVPQKVPQLAETEEREWRADPSDGLRPRLHLRRQEAN